MVTLFPVKTPERTRDREIAKQQLPGLLPSQPKDGLQAGRDLGAPVGNYAAPFAFDGVIRSATLDIKAAE